MVQLWVPLCSVIRNIITSLVSSRSGDNQNAGLGLLIFFALLLHKAPAALGFGSFLRHEKVNQASLIKHLGVSLRLTHFLVFYSCRSDCYCHFLFRTAILGKRRNQWEKPNVLGGHPSSHLSWLLPLCCHHPYLAWSILQHRHSQTARSQASPWGSCSRRGAFQQAHWVDHNSNWPNNSISPVYHSMS